MTAMHPTIESIDLIRNNGEGRLAIDKVICIIG